MVTKALEQGLKTEAISHFTENLKRINKCLSLLDEDHVWISTNEHTNSIANLILHLSGNIRQYVIASLGNEKDLRNRNLEFFSHKNYSKSQLQEQIESTVGEALKIFNQLTTDELIRLRPVQCYEMSGLAILIHVVEHFSYHTGQIALITKLITEKDLGFYADQALNEKNQ